MAGKVNWRAACHTSLYMQPTKQGNARQGTFSAHSASLEVPSRCSAAQLSIWGLRQQRSMPDIAHLDFEVSYTGSNRFTGFQMVRISSLSSSSLFSHASKKEYIARCLPLWRCKHGDPAGWKDNQIIAHSPPALALEPSTAKADDALKHARTDATLRLNRKDRCYLSAGHAAGDSTGASSQQSLSTGVQTFQNGQGQTPELVVDKPGWEKAIVIITAQLRVVCIEEKTYTPPS